MAFPRVPGTTQVLNNSQLGTLLSVNGTPNLVSDAIVFNSATDGEMLRIEQGAFYVRGKKVQAGPNEAQQVFNAFKYFLKKSQR